QGKQYFYDPSLSPASNEIAFVSGGDIWTVPATGGEARLLVSHPAMETRPLFSPDGTSLAFHSTRSGNGDIYILDLKSNAVKRLTYDDGNDELSAWSKDGKYIYFSSISRDISGMRDVFRIKATGGTPMLVSDNRYINEFSAAPSPTNNSLAIVARGFGAIQWWRNGRSHLDESEIWLLNEDDKKYTRIAEKGAKQLWPMWSADGKNLYYVSDRNGNQNIWMQPVNGTAKQITQFKDGRVLFPAISYNGNTIVFERDFAIWKMDLTTNESKPVSITLRGAPASPSVDYMRLTTGFGDVSLSPDGKKLAFTAQGEVFVAGAKDGGDAVRITTTTGMETDLTWSSNSNSLFYTSDRRGKKNIYQYNFLTGKESPLTTASEDVGSLTLSPDGKKLAFVRARKEIRVLDLASGKETLLAKGNLVFSPIATGGSIAWSPDNKWIAYASYGSKSFHNIHVVPAQGGEARQVSFLANSFGGNLTWGGDGKTILFTTVQRTENGQVARIDLQPRQPRFREDQFRDLFSQPAPAETPAKPKTDPAVNPPAPSQQSQQISFEGIRERLSFLPLGVDVNNMDLSKDGNTLVIVASIAGQPNIYTYSLDELSREPAVLKQLTFTPGFKNHIQFSADGKELFYTENGRVQSVNIDSRQVKPINLTAEMAADFKERKMEVFRQAWELQNKGFYDENFHGVNWQEVKTKYEPYAAGAQTPDELRRILNLMVGELNASHSGVGANTPSATNTGHLGLRFERDAYEKDGKLRVREVIALGPAALSESIKIGNYITAIDGEQITSSTNVDQLLENKVNRRVVLSVSSNANGANAKEVVVKPVNLNTEKGLLYKQWVQQSRDYVHKISNGRLGYVHMFDMGQNSLDQLYIDMDAENHAKEGVVIDIRNNNGGFVNAYALDVFARRGYMTMTVRGLEPAPARTMLGQRALDAPTILVTNQHSLSDAEDFSEGYQTLGLGKVVGEPTSAWIIYTSNITLFDGTIIRLPFIKITDNKGNNMELEPRPVDITVSNPLGEPNKDAQLDVAVSELLKQIIEKKK
ncbi:MAG: S41 family peptidase, partial [Chitinophagaceae bacterium]